MSGRRNVGQNSTATRTLQLPSIEVTLDDDRPETRSTVDSVSATESTSPTARLHERRLRGKGRWAVFASKRGALSFTPFIGPGWPILFWLFLPFRIFDFIWRLFMGLTMIPHLITGIALIATSGVVRNILTSKPNQPASSPQFDQRPLNSSYPPFLRSSNVENGKAMLSQNVFRLRHQNFEKPCEAVTCSQYLALICIAVGSMFIICGVSGALMTFHDMKEYVSCYLVWISVSSLASIVFIAACIMGLKTSYNEKEGITRCVCVIIISTSVEIFFCVVNLYLWQALAGNTHSGEGRGSSRRHANAREPHSGQDNDIGGTPMVEGAMGPGRQRQNASGRGNRTANPRVGHNPRRRRSGQAIRDRNSLHPGYHHQARNRMRRRPILRAQNHYVLVPAAYGRSRAPSRVGRRLSAARRNRVEMPMFVIANHDRYVQALNQSMETLETQPNRGSVPGYVLPSSQENGAHGLGAGDAPRMQRTVLEKTDSVDTTLSWSSLESSKVTPRLDAARHYAFDNQNAVKGVEFHRKLGDGSAYSVVRRTKEGLKVNPQQHSESEPDAEWGACSGVRAPALSPPALPKKMRRPTSAMEDSVFQPPRWERSDSSHCMTDSEYSSNKQKKSTNQAISAVSVRSRFYNTASEGDFTNMGASNASHERIGHASVSSDSGIADAPLGMRPERRHYHNVPMHISPRVSIELTDFSVSGQHFPHSPVSPATPSYENLNSQSGIEMEDNFFFTTNVDRIVNKDPDH